MPPVITSASSISFQYLPSCLYYLLHEIKTSFATISVGQRRSIGAFIADLASDASVTTFLSPAALQFGALKDFVTDWVARVPAVDAHLSGAERSSLTVTYRACLDAMAKGNKVFLNVLHHTVGARWNSNMAFTDHLAVLLQKVLLHFVSRYEEVRARLGQDVPADASPIAGSHNPPLNGASYSFNEQGERVRNIRHVEDLDKLRQEEDNGPCSKLFPNLAGKSYVMFFFCPFHGHCYGTFQVWCSMIDSFSHATQCTLSSRVH